MYTILWLIKLDKENKYLPHALVLCTERPREQIRRHLIPFPLWPDVYKTQNLDIKKTGWAFSCWKSATGRWVGQGLFPPSPYCTVSLLDCRLTGPLGFCSWPAVTAPLTTAEEIPYCVLYSFPRTPRTKETVARLKQQKFIHLQFGSLRVWEIWESEKSMLSLKALEEGPSVPLPHFQWLPAILAASSFQSRSLLSQGVFLCSCLQISLFPLGHQSLG